MNSAIWIVVIALAASTFIIFYLKKVEQTILLAAALFFGLVFYGQEQYFVGTALMLVMLGAAIDSILLATSATWRRIRN